MNKRFLIKIFALFTLLFLLGCVAEKSETAQRGEEGRTTENRTVTEVCQNCHVKFKTSLSAQKMALNSPTHGLCPSCKVAYQKTHPKP